MGCCNATELQNDAIVIDASVTSTHPRDAMYMDPNIILPSTDAAEFSEQRERFMTNITVVDTAAVEDAVIVPRKGSMSPNGGTSPVSNGFSESVMPAISPETSEKTFFESRTQRIATATDVYSMDIWWGIGPETPDRRLTASMPGHVMVTDVEEVLVHKVGAIEQVRDELKLEDVCRTSQKYVLWQMKLGKVCLLSLHRVIDDDMYHKVLNAQGGDLLKDSLKLIVMPINLALNVPVKGPKDADTIGTFFGAKNTHYSRPTNGACKYDIAMISIDLYSVWSLKMLLPSVAFKAGRMVDFHLVSYRDNAVLASFRAAMTPQVIQQIKQLA
mmetsp:Transcript_116126/g.182698  ORF Transcript_116126/g.182698 Transcript_116126/m.182698 type:complete len:329 (+) Transcript_116126:39-1025(+)|eukprot:CAMPEP_0169087742 /NCGR_PEP_ID=MMETSP1015-20121227/14389_1 /TAXON_ID=342587 /ORGANISM="Karlodinium micrum, Strain CCMP2283" /LENGTH=328 /DNA_ID=CAMNT_0009147983 /DNA_START=34 /DNA_END=1020 /DNA_ORIENTATION=+